MQIGPKIWPPTKSITIRCLFNYTFRHGITKMTTPTPPTYVTSFMNDPLPKHKESSVHLVRALLCRGHFSTFRRPKKFRFLWRQKRQRRRQPLCSRPLSCCRIALVRQCPITKVENRFIFNIFTISSFFLVSFFLSFFLQWQPCHFLYCLVTVSIVIVLPNINVTSFSSNSYCSNSDYDVFIDGSRGIYS